ncbi:MAG: PD-(D/E)XK motif protein [Oligoflexus sp.]
MQLPLKSVVDSLYDGRPPSGGKLKAKALPLSTGRNLYIGIDAADDLHLLLQPSLPKLPPYLTGMRLKGLKCQIQELEVEGKGVQEWVALTCFATKESEDRTPFLSLCEDILRSIRKNSVAVEESLAQVLKRWRKFWATDGPPRFSEAWVKGIFGELLCLEKLILKGNPRIALEVWTGPLGLDHDFQAKNIAFEVKATTSRPPIIRVNTLNQFDETLVEKLLLLNILISKDETGNSLLDVVSRIETLFQNSDEECLEVFWDRLVAAGYRRHYEHIYDSFRFVIDSFNYYIVHNDFPRITNHSLKGPLDSRIERIEYCIEITGLTPIGEHHPEVEAALMKMLSP